ncbi:MAG: hypothetical protein ACUVTX_05795 [Bacteroidales bacterium]
MREKRLMNQISAIFGIFMTFFYISVGLYLILANNLYYIDKFLKNIVGYTFLFYSLYRGYMSYLKIKEAFWSDRDNGKEKEF